MCGRFVSITDAEGLARFLVVDGRIAENLGPNYNVAPTQEVYAAVEHDDARHLVTLHWGLIPSWAKDPKIAGRLINARSETAAEKPSFRAAYRRRRCLLPADGFYEWAEQPDGSKAPFYISRRDGAPLTFAGLWEVWRDPSDEASPARRTCTILTTAANRSLSALHARMPVILEPSQWDGWLDRDCTDPATVARFIGPAGDDVLQYHRVSRAVNNPRQQGPGLLAPAPGVLEPEQE